MIQNQGMTENEETMYVAFCMLSNIDEFRPDSELRIDEFEIFEETMEGNVAFCSVQDYDNYFRHCNEEVGLVTYYGVVGCDQDYI